MLAKAIELATRAHDGQLDKGGSPYIFHPMRLMLQLSKEEDWIAAILHDVVEDTDWTLEKLADEGFSREVVSIIDSLTRREGESYENYIGRLVHDPAACRIKLLDLKDNQDLTRIREHTQETRDRLEKYQRAERRILNAMK